MYLHAINLPDLKLHNTVLFTYYSVLMILRAVKEQISTNFPQQQKGIVY